MNRVVITGAGIYSCLGKSLPEVRDSLYQGKSGIIFDPARKEMGFRSALTSKVDLPDLKGMLHRKLRNNLAEQGEFAYLAAKEAFENSAVDQAYLDENEVGVLFGNDSSARAVVETCEIMKEKRDTMLLGSEYIFQSMNSTVTMNLATIFHLKGINFTVSGACAGGSHAIGIGYHLIRHGLQHMILCGGAQEINAYSMASFDGLSAFSVRESAPQKASRPFDRDRDGLVPGGGAAAIVIESLESAQKRGAKILAEIIGWGFSSDGDHISRPNATGPARAMQKALADACIKTGEIDYINAHATSTPVGDSNEAKAITQIFGEKTPMVSSTKSMTGHECWMSGASEIVYSLLMMQNSFVAPNINFENPDEFTAKLAIVAKTLDTKINTVLSNSFGFGGTNSVLIIKKISA
ncbi:MAG: beta-ketoacyl synthase [Spirochaetes bacterium GWF1_41_5]|nr:MAG: beta-ketoacyl synthase [Spirochaetes bacterium GWF1_41_5]